MRAFEGVASPALGLVELIELPVGFDWLARRHGPRATRAEMGVELAVRARAEAWSA